MDSRRLSREVLRAHNTRDGDSDKMTTASQSSSMAPIAKKFGLGNIHERSGTMLSESGSSGGTGKLKLLRLRNKIKLFGGSFSKSGSETHVQKVLENTYRTEPVEGTKFSQKKAEEIVNRVLEAYLKGKTYDPKKFPNLSKSLAELIKERVKATGCKRYKLIAHVMILENQGQSMRHVSRCLWNKDTDNYATATFEGNNFTAVGSIFATYYD